MTSSGQVTEGIEVQPGPIRAPLEKGDFMRGEEDHVTPSGIFLRPETPASHFETIVTLPHMTSRIPASDP